MRSSRSGERPRTHTTTIGAALLAAAVALPGCAALYGPNAEPEDFMVTFMTVPLDVNMSGEAQGEDKALRDDTKRLTLNGLVDLNWGNNGVGYIAAKNGLDSVRYADRQIMSFFGIWTQQFVHLYGTSSPAATEAVEAKRAAEEAERHEGHEHAEEDEADEAAAEHDEMAERKARRDAAEAELDTALEEQDSGDS
jgi:hypothetical protein